MANPAGIAQRLGSVRVGLRRDLAVSRHQVGGETNYVYHDPVAFQNHAFTIREYQVMNAIRADRSLKDVFDGLVERDVLADDEQDEFFGFVVVLHGFGLLRLPISESSKLFDRYTRKQAAKRRALWMAPMYLKVPLWDPDKFLSRTLRFVRPLFSKGGVFAWAMLWGLVVWNLLGHGGEMIGEASGMLTAGNVPMLYVGLILLKAIHELGHGYCCKYFGAEVPEIGVAFIIATPCAYVDASASWKLRSRWRRIAVGMAGMYFESIIAAIFALVWVGTRPGFAHDFALNIFVLSSATTLLFNVNPLMRFDGYYVFADLIGVTNLRDRSARFIKDWARFVFVGLGSLPQVGRRMWLASYGVASSIYKVSLAFGISTMMLLYWPMGGLVLSVFFAFIMIVMPVWRLFRWLWSHEDTECARVRARSVAVGVVLIVPLLFGYLPVSHTLVMDGVLEPERSEILRAPSDGFVTAVRCVSGQQLVANQDVVVLGNAQLNLEVSLVDEQLHAETLQAEAYLETDASRGAYHAAGASYLRQRLATLKDRQGALVVRTELGGTVMHRQPVELLGSYVRAGDPLIEVQSGGHRVRALMLVEDLQRAPIRVGDMATLRWAAAPDREVAARVVQVFPSASRKAIPMALTSGAGGKIFMMGSYDGQDRADASYLHVLLEPAWVPVDVRSRLTANVQFGGKVRTLGQWARKRLFELYSAWQMS